MAASLVFVCHASLAWLAADGRPADNGLLYLGRFGVAIFFVISGLVIYKPFAESAVSGRIPDLWAYALRRVVRIVPAYWVALAFFAVLLPEEVRPLSYSGIGVFAGFGQIYSPGNYSRGLPVAWTLDVEVCFYAAVPIVAVCVAQLIAHGASRRLEGLVLLCLGLASIAVRRASPSGIIGGTLAGYTGWFAIGMGLAVAVVHASPWLRRVTARPALLWLLAGGGYLLVAHYLTAPFPPQGTMLDYCVLGGLAALIVLTALDANASPTRVGKWLGDRSYGIYLWHYPIITWISMKHYAGWHYIADTTLLTLLAAHLSYGLLERPLMHRTAALLRRRRTIFVGPAPRDATSTL